MPAILPDLDAMTLPQLRALDAALRAAIAAAGAGGGGDFAACRCRRRLGRRQLSVPQPR
jgi:hypothetical protein